MEKFEFKGDWKFHLRLEEFFGFCKEWKEDQKKLVKNDLVPVKIMDYKSYDPDPSKEQIATIHLILNNQEQILEGLLQALITVNSHYVEMCGEDDWIPSPLSVENLHQLISIGELIILTEHKDGQAYYQLDCGYQGDQEHGLSIVMHKDRFIEHSPHCEMDYGGVYTDLGTAAEAVRSTNISNRDFGENQVHKALPKYGKLKPWQTQATVDYLGNLLRTKDNERLKDIVEKENFDFNLRIDYQERNLVDLAAYYGNIEMIEYLVDKGGDYSQTMKEGAQFYIKKEVVECLVKKGASVDQFTNSQVTPLQHEISSYVSMLSRMHQYKDNNAYQYESAQKQLADHKDKLCFYLSLGADPNNCDVDGNNYKQVLLKRWKEKKLTSLNVEPEIDEFIKIHQRKNQ